MGNYRQRARMFAEQDGICAYCGGQMVLPAITPHPQPMNLCTIDHIIPLIRGGSNALHNKVACCMHCNALKKGHTAESLRLMADRIERLIATRHPAPEFEGGR